MPPPEIVRTAKLRWDTGQGPTTFQALFGRSRDKSGILEIYKGGPTPVLRLALDPSGRAVVSGPAVGVLWRGNAATVPPEISVLLGALSLFIHEDGLPEGSHEIHTAALATALTKSGRLRTLGIRSADAPVTADVVFSQG